MFSGRSRSNLDWQNALSTFGWVEKEKMQDYMHMLNESDNPLEKLQMQCLLRGPSGIMKLGRVFREFDDYGRKRLNKHSFLNALKKSGYQIDLKDMEEFFDRFDGKEEDYISVEKFFKELRPPLNECRFKILEEAFKKLDQNGDGQVTLDNIRKIYSVKENLRYKSGEETKEHILDTFLGNFVFDVEAGDTVTFEDFINFYSALSASVEKDCTFDLMIREAYKL